jgi:hypothetical protein
MNGDELMEIVGDIDDRFVEKAYDTQRKKGASGWLMPAAAVFVAAVIALGAILYNKPIRLVTPKPLGVMLLGDLNGISRSFEIFKKEELEVAKNEPVELIHKYDAEREKEIQGESKCVLRIGFFVYGGRLYRHVDLGDFGSDELVGEKLGHVRGVGWLGKDPATYDELTGLTGGDIYEVKGFDPEFMVCRKGYGSRITTYVCNCGYVISKGEDVFEQRYRFSDRLETLVYEKPGDHLYKKQYALDPALPEVRSFIEAIDKASWHLMDVMDALWLDTEQWIENDYHKLIFKLGGVDVTATLYNGYHLFIDGFDGCAIDLDEKDIKPLLELMESHEKSVPVENNSDSQFVTVEEARQDPRFGRYVPSFIPEGYELYYCIIRYSVDMNTGKRTGTERISFDFMTKDEKHILVVIGSVSDALEDDAGTDEDKRCTAPIGELTANNIKENWGDNGPEPLRVCGYNDEASIRLSASGVSREDMLRIVRSGFDGK